MKRSRAITYYYSGMLLMVIGMALAIKGYYNFNGFLRHLMISSSIIFIVASIVCYARAYRNGVCPHCRQCIEFRTRAEFCPKCGGRIPFDQEIT